MRIEGRHKLKKWVRPWMVWAVFYPIKLVYCLCLAPTAAAGMVEAVLFECDFDDD